MQRFQMLRQLKRGLYLEVVLASNAHSVPHRDALGACSNRTSERSTSGGPSAISSAFVPGCILRDAPWSNVLKSFCCSSVGAIGDLGPSWSSAIGGGLGSRGELEGDAAILCRIGEGNATE